MRNVRNKNMRKKQPVRPSLVERPGINKSDTLKKLSAESEAFIALRDYRLHIDRLQFTVRNRSGYYQRVKDALCIEFHHLGGRWDEEHKKYIHRYIRGDVRLQLVFHISCIFNFSIVVSDPCPDIQSILRGIFNRMKIVSVVTITQVEFALDLFPVHKRDLYDLRMVLSKMIMLRQAQGLVFKRVGSTDYWGLRGNVRRGAKGARGYLGPKPKKGTSPDFAFYRVEMQANRRMVRSLGLDVTSLPIKASFSVIFKALQLRRGLDKTGLRKLVSAIRRKLVRDGKWPQTRDLSMVIRLRILARMVLEHMVDDGVCDPMDLALPTAQPVAKQISYFKKLKTTYKLSHQIDYFFARVNSAALVRDIDHGFVRRVY